MMVRLHVYDEHDEKRKEVRAATDISGSNSEDLSRLIDLLGAGYWLAAHQSLSRIAVGLSNVNLSRCLTILSLMLCSLC